MFSQRNFSGTVSRDNTFTGLVYKVSEKNCIINLPSLHHMFNKEQKSMAQILTF